MIELRNLSISAKERILTHQLNVKLKSRQVWGLLGPNGCGKSTLLHTIAKVIPPKQGEIYINGFHQTVFSTKKFAQHVGILFQEMSSSFSQTVWDYCLSARFPHLSLFQKHSPADFTIIQSALTHLDMFHLKHRALTALSGGERKRAAIAALLVQNPTIYLLDEPTNHLDLPHQTRVMQTFAHKASEGCSILMSLHDPNMAERYCDHVLLMFPHGELVFGSTPEVLTENNLSRLYGVSIKQAKIHEKKFWHTLVS